MQQPPPKLIYKVVPAETWRESASLGVLQWMPVDVADGFLHFSTAAQLPKTLELYFAGQTDLTLLAVETARVAENLEWEVSRGGDLFPHLYADLPLDRVAWTAPLDVAENGAADLPGAVA